MCSDFLEILQLTSAISNPEKKRTNVRDIYCGSIIAALYFGINKTDIAPFNSGSGESVVFMSPHAVPDVTSL